MIRMLLAALALVFLWSFGYAADANTTVDIAPAISQFVVPIVVALLGLLATWLSARVATWLGLKANSELAFTLESAMTNGLAYGQSLVTQRLGNGPVPVNLHNEIVATAANYALAHVPEALKALGVDQAALIQKLKARLALNTTPPEQSVAVPTPSAAGGAG